jgi:hypothetical protein
MHGPRLQKRQGAGDGNATAFAAPAPACDNALMQAARVSIQTEDFDVSAELAALRARDARVGAVCSLTTN